MPCRAVSTFWIAHPNNHLISNAAAGSQVSNIKCFPLFCFPVYKYSGLYGRDVTCGGLTQDGGGFCYCLFH